MPTTQRRLQHIRLEWPFKGLSEIGAYADQQASTSPSLLNVMAFDARTGRRRGGSRSGFSKFCSSRVNGLAAIQNLNHVSNVLVPANLLLEDGNDLLLETGASSPFLLEEDSAEHVGDRQTVLVAVAGGTAKAIINRNIIDITNGTNTLSSLRDAIFSTQFFSDIYYCDSYNYRIYDSSSNTMTAWTPTAGSLPSETVDGVARTASMIVTWAGRIVLSGLQTDAHNYFMSKIDDALDYDYLPAVTTIEQAIAGSSSLAGLCPDIITALIPFKDDVLLFGGDHTLWRLRGNPAEDGRFDLVSDITGVAPGQSWCKSPEGIIYFVGSRGGVYKLHPDGGGPSRLTALSIDERLADIHLKNHQVSLVWDDRHMGVRVFITRRAVGGVVQSSTEHYFWDVRDEAWYMIKHSNKHHNPLAVHLFDGPDPDDRAVLVGTQEGWILKCDPDALHDDGSPIESHVFLGPLENLTIVEIQATLATNSGNVQWTIHSAEDFETALESPPAASGQFVSGRNRSQWPRRHVNAGYLRLASAESWALEKITLGVEQDTEARTRIF